MWCWTVAKKSAAEDDYRPNSRVCAAGVSPDLGSDPFFVFFEEQLRTKLRYGSLDGVRPTATSLHGQMESFGVADPESVSRGL